MVSVVGTGICCPEDKSHVEKNKPQRVVVLGSTGSIGCSTLDVLGDHPGQFEVYALAAHRSVEKLADQCQQHQPEYAVIADKNCAIRLEKLLRERSCLSKVLAGEQALKDLAAAPEVDTVVAGIVGAVGLPSTMSAVQAGKKVLLANKETLVVAGDLFIRAVQQSNAVLLPIDSEHNAIFQCLPNVQTLAQSDFDSSRPELRDFGVRKLLLTGSGGPFRTYTTEQLSKVTPEQACAHPNWSMGQKISVDSATMMNKGLELIEACWLFNCSADLIEIIVHPQSIVHSMVEYLDGSVLAQLGSPDMRTPIAHALAWPRRVETQVERLNWAQLGQLNFEEPNVQKFPALSLARDVAVSRGSAAVVLNAANEVAVAAFLKKEIGFLDIVRITQRCMEMFTFEEPESIEHIQELDRRARALAEQAITS